MSLYQKPPWAGIFFAFVDGFVVAKSEGKASEDLLDSIHIPKDGEKVKVRGNKVLDGNTRVNEAKGRGWSDDTQIPVEELPELPDNIDDNPLGPYGG